MPTVIPRLTAGVAGGVGVSKGFNVAASVNATATLAETNEAAVESQATAIEQLQDDLAATNAEVAEVATAVNGLIDISDSTASVLSFGAVGDGVADDTVAIQAALDSDNRVIVFPKTSKFYLCRNLSIPEGKHLIGVGRVRPYTATGYSDFDGTVAIVLKQEAGSDALISLGGPGCYFYGLNFVGYLDRSKPLFSASSIESTAFFDYCGAYFFSFGFGKNGGYIRNSRFFNCHAHNNNVGFCNLIDSHVQMCEINANKLDGIQMLTGSGDTSFVGNKVEWNGRYNWHFNSSSNSTVNGGVCDRSTDHGMRIVQSQLSINGVMFRRNGRAGGKAHIQHENNTSLIVSGCNSATGVDDGGGGTLAPDFFSVGAGAASGFNLISSCNVTGAVISTSSGVQSQIFYKNCRGNPDTPMPHQSVATTVATASSNTTSVSGSWLKAIAATLPETSKIKVCIVTRNTTSGAVASQEFIVQLSRTGGGSGVSAIVFKQQSASTSINDTGAALNVVFNNVAADCASFDIVCSNTTANSLQLRLQVYQYEQN